MSEHDIVKSANIYWNILKTNDFQLEVFFDKKRSLCHFLLA